MTARRGGKEAASPDSARVRAVKLVNGPMRLLGASRDFASRDLAAVSRRWTAVSRLHGLISGLDELISALSAGAACACWRWSLERIGLEADVAAMGLLMGVFGVWGVLGENRGLPLENRGLPLALESEDCRW